MRSGIEAGGGQRHLPVTVAVATYGRDSVLCDTLRDLLGQDYPACQIVVVDQAPNHDAETARFLRSVGPRVCYQVMEEPNLPKARNRCVQLATGDIVVFVDDDVRLEPHFVSWHASNYSDPAVWAVVGSVLGDSDAVLRPVVAERRCVLGRPQINYDSERRGSVHGGRGCNMSLRRGVFDTVGLFDVCLPPPYLREDTDLFLRMSRAGLGIVYDPRAKLVHLRRSAGGTSDGKVYRKRTPSERVPWQRTESYICETVFQLKHFTWSSMPLYAVYFLVGWVFMKNRGRPGPTVRSVIAFITGTIKGIGYYRRHYGDGC